MEYQLTWAKDGKDEKLVKAAKANRLPIPKAILEKPIVKEWDWLYWECFNDLCGSRPMANGLGFIPWDSINNWASRHGIGDAEQFEGLRYVVGKMDEFWVDHFRQRKN